MLVIRKMSLGFVAMLLLSSSSFAIAGNIKDADCRSPEFVNETVVTQTDAVSNDVSWRSWFSGDSRSKQFHYLDLLELLLRDGDDSDDGSPPSYE